jgi:tol-pal system protein YbgF
MRLSPLKVNLPLFFSLFSLLVVGCATTEDLNRVRGELNYQIQSVNEKIATVERQFPSLKEETQSIHDDLAKTNAEFPPLRVTLAELRAEITDIREKHQQLRGAIDSIKEEIRKENSSFAIKTGKREEAEKLLRDKIDNLTFKINFIENFLGVSKKDEQVGSVVAAGKSVNQPQPVLKNEVQEPVKTDKSSLYSAAFALFKEGKYENARESFESFLKQYPNTEFSDNALFWVGECYYFEKKYEKAIVEYDKLVKGFPGSNKISYALLKQGLSFLKLKDKVSARLLLQQVTKDYPNTSQERIARAKLLEIK